MQPAGVGQVDRERVVVVGLGLADVVQQRAGDRDVAVEAGEEVGGGADGLGDRDGVLEQPAPVGLVVVLGGGGLAEPLPGGCSGAEEAGQQLAQRGVLDRLEQLAQLLLQQSASLGGPSARSSASYSPARAAGPRRA